MSRYLISLVVSLLIATSGLIGIEVGSMQDKPVFHCQNPVEATVESNLIIHEEETVITNTLSPIVIITQPPDGTVLHTRDVTILGYAQDEVGMNYWEWQWIWNGEVIYSNSEYFQTAEYVEFRIDIHGLKPGENLIIVDFKNVYGGMGEDSVRVYYVDNTPPTVVITSPADGSVFTDPFIVVEGYATDGDGSGIVYLRWDHSCGNYSEGDSETYPIPYAALTFYIPINLWPGENWIKVTARDEAGNEGSDTIIVYLVEPLTADADGPYHGGVNQDIQFHGSASGGMPSYSWHWDFGDGKTSNQQNPKHAYTKAGTYTAKLTVTDSLGNTASDTAQVVVSEELTADADGPYHGEVKKDIQFQGSASGGKPPYTYQWDFGDGKTSNQQNPKHAYTKAGTYTAKLTVTDSEGNTDTDTAQVKVYKKLKAEADGPYGGLVNQAIQFHGSATGGVPPYSWRWAFGDGGFDIIQNPVHAYSNEGVYTATLTVTDSIGNIASDTALVYIYRVDDQPPFIEITRPNNSLYLKDREIMPLRDKAVIIGNITIRADASDNIGIAKVEFYIDNQLKHTNYTPPYYWLWNETTIGKHIIKAVAYDFAGHTAVDEQEVFIINLKIFQ